MMDLLQHLSDGFVAIGSVHHVLALAAGVCLGILIGAIPGLSPSMGVALAVPFTYSMSPMMAIVLLGVIYLAADYGGSITAVTINTPGTPAATVTAYDGYPLALAGRAGHGLGISLVASSTGGLIGTLILIFFCKPLAQVALSFHPAEYFALALFGLTSVAGVGGENAIRALLMAALGLLINTIGEDPLSGVSRFTFGIPQLYEGFSLIPALIGLFAISEVCAQVEANNLSSPSASDAPSTWPKWRDYWKLKTTIVRSSFIGTLIGVFPGAGATIASFISYDIAKRLSANPEEFGQGSPHGIAASEAANSSSVGGALVPLLTLGIPGSASTAVMIGALMIHDVAPGPRLIQEHPDIVYGLFASLLLGNVLILVLGGLGSRLWIRVTDVPKPILFPLILAAAIVGSYAVRHSMFDVGSCLGFGLLGWILKRHGFPVVPIVLGMVLGGIIEENFRQAVLLDGYTTFIRRPKSAAILLVALAVFLVPLWHRGRLTKREKP
jgi:putative tricarboxylic transport membrane protein